MNDITYVGRHSLIHFVSRHTHENWEFIYCTYGSGTLFFDDRAISYQKGDVVVIPPLIPHKNSSDSGFKNLHINMAMPALSLKEPALIKDDSNHFLLDAFNAAFFHYYSDREERSALLSSYGSLISCILSSYQTVQPHTKVVEEIELDILRHCSDCDYNLSAFLRTYPFSYDYLRKLFQKELGVTPHKYLMDKRMQFAAEALINNGSDGSTVADIALMCGFREPLYFSRMFKKKYGVSPTSYLKNRKDVIRLDGESVKLLSLEE